MRDRRRKGNYGTEAENWLTEQGRKSGSKRFQEIKVSDGFRKAGGKKEISFPK